MKKTGVFLFLTTAFEETEAVVCVDILRRAGIHVQMVSLTQQLLVVGSHGISITADVLFEEANFDEVDMLIFPGGSGSTAFINHDGLCQLVKSHHDKWLAAICAAPLFLFGLGLMKNRKMVCYPSCEKELSHVQLVPQLVVCDGNIVTARGPHATEEFAYCLVALLEGEQKAKAVREAFVAPW